MRAPSLALIWSALLLGGCDLMSSMLPQKAATAEAAQQAIKSCGLSSETILWRVTGDGSFAFGKKAADAPAIPPSKTECLLKWARDNRVRVAFLAWESADAHNQAAQANPVPVQPAGRVTDSADVLSTDRELQLTAKLQQLEQATGHQMVVVTVASLGGRDVADVARDLGNSWGIGRKDYDDGVVLLVAPSERKVRIAVGHGLERRLPRSVCQDIIEKEMLPLFRQGDIPGGVTAGTVALVNRLS